jgi:methylmalonyl-CoA/ethylmalonyl-CoA epimerase
MKYKYTDAPGPQLQLCEPNDGPSPQRKFLDRTGGGVFHIGFVVDDVDDATEQAHSAWRPGCTAVAGTEPGPP